jgi:DNA-binding MarR family transcriptional regulator
VLSDFQALELWRHTLVASVRSDAADLSARQTALLLSIYMTEGPQTVRGLAKTLHISKPAVSRALDRLGELGYIRRERDDLDRRNVLVQRTNAGVAYLKSFATMIEQGQHAVAAQPDKALDFGLSPVAVVPAPAPAASIPAAEPQVWIDVAA